MSKSANSIFVILLAGGTGSRYGGNLPKQLLKLNGETLIRRSVRRFREWGLLKSIVIVMNAEYILNVENESSDILESGDRIVEGGETRHKSTINGLKSLKEIGIADGDHVFIHDVARPYFLYSELDELVLKSEKVGAATLAAINLDTNIRMLGDYYISEIIPRDGLYRVKTPQIAQWKVLEKLMSHSIHSEPTDLCTWCKELGLPVGIVPSEEWNIKITNPGDMEITEALLPGLQTLYPDIV